MVHIKLNRGIFRLDNNNNNKQILYSSRVKYIITGNPVVYIKALNKTLTPKSLMEGRSPRNPGAATAITTPPH